MTNGEDYQRGMVIVAHADDAEFGCAGTVASWCRSGMEVVQVICTDGSKGSDDPNMTSAQLGGNQKAGAAERRPGASG